MILTDYFNALKFRFNKGPSHLILFVTARCNARCRHCFYWQEIEESCHGIELSLNEIEKISSNLGHIKFLTITGGEPSLRDDLPEIISTFSRNNRTHHVALHTNGFLTGKILELVVRAAEANPKVDINVAVSIDAMAEQHDFIRGVAGIFDKAISTLDGLHHAQGRYPNISVTVNSCFNAYNQDEVRKLSDYLFDNHLINGYYLSWVRGDVLDSNSRSVDVQKYLEEISRLQRKAVISRYDSNYPLASLRRTLDFLAPRVVTETVITGKMPYPCMAGRSVIVISETGELKPCEMLKKGFGNVRDYDYDVGKMLSSVAGKTIKQDIADRKCCCTWECAVMNSLVFNWQSYPRVVKTWLILEFKKRFGK